MLNCANEAAVALVHCAPDQYVIVAPGISTGICEHALAPPEWQRIFVVAAAPATLACTAAFRASRAVVLRMMLSLLSRKRLLSVMARHSSGRNTAPDGVNTSPSLNVTSSTVRTP